MEIIQTLSFLAPEIAPLSLSKKSSILWFIFLKVSRSMLSSRIWQRPPPISLNPSAQPY